MCPLCIGTAAWLITGASSAGGIGLAAVATKVLHPKSRRPGETNASRLTERGRQAPESDATASGCIDRSPR